MELLQLKFETNYEPTGGDQELLNIFDQLDTAKDIVHESLINKLLEAYEKCEINDLRRAAVRNILIRIFTKFTYKKSIKKCLHDKIVQSNLYNELLLSSLQDICSQLEHSKICNITQCSDLIFYFTTGTSRSDNNEVVLNNIFRLYLMVFEGYLCEARTNFRNISSQLTEVNALMSSIFKQILSNFVKHENFKKLLSKDYSIKIIVLCYEVIKQEQIVLDIKIKCGLIFVHTLNTIPEEYKKALEYREHPVLELIAHSSEQHELLLNDHKIPNFLDDDISKIIIYSATFNILTVEILLKYTINGKVLVFHLYNELIDCAKRTTNEPHLIIEVSRIISVIGKQLKVIPVEYIKPLFLDGLTFIWTHIEHFVDVVRQNTRSFLDEMVKLAVFLKEQGHPDYLDVFLENVKFTVDSHCIRFFAYENIASNLSCAFLFEHFYKVPDSLLNLILKGTVAEQACKTFIFLMVKHMKESDYFEWINLWVLPVMKMLQCYQKNNQLFQKIIYNAFQMNPSILRIVFPDSYVGNSQVSGAHLKCLQLARSSGIKVPYTAEEDNSRYWRGLIEKHKLDLYKIHQDEEIRISALAVIVESQRTTQPFLDWEFNYLISFLKYNVTSQVPNLRKQIISFYRKALARYEASYGVITRQIANCERRKETYESEESFVYYYNHFLNFKRSYQIFLGNFTRMLVSNLTFDSNCWRRCTSLELLVLIRNLMAPDCWRNCWTDTDIISCHNILYDSYESNKKISVTLLLSLTHDKIGFTDKDTIDQYMDKCLELAVDIKPSKTLSAAYMFQLCAHIRLEEYQRAQSLDKCPLLEMIEVLTSKLNVSNNINEDVFNSKISQHGILLSIRHLLQIRDLSKDNESFAALFEHLYKTCMEIKKDIMPIVSNPSPEGYIPEDADLACEMYESTKAQMIIIYAWRTMKELTILLAEVVRQSIKLENTHCMLSTKALKSIGEFFINVFLETKHKGVFEQAYSGFSVICQSFWISSNKKINHLPRTWLKDILWMCTGKKQCDKLCVTRRSAGLPFPILSILSTEPTFDKPGFRGSMETLLKLFENTDPSYDEYKMHSMNVLSLMFRHSKLGEHVAPYVGRAVIVAISGFKSASWSIRNSSSLFYATLMIRMFGVQRTQDSDDPCMKNRLTVRIFFMRYPELFQFLLDTLKTECKKTDTLILHPTLLILARLYPSHFEARNEQIEQYVPHLTACLSNPVYRTRDLAAKASVPLILSSPMQDYIDNTLERFASNDLTNTECHGLLLQMYFLLKSTNVIKLPIAVILPKTVHLLKNVGESFAHATVALYMDLITLMLTKHPEYDDLVVMRQIVEIVSQQIKYDLVPITSKTRFLQSRLLLIMFIVLNKFEETESTYFIMANELVMYLYADNIEMKHYCLFFLIYLNQLAKKPDNEEHPLFQLGELEIPQSIICLVDALPDECRSKMLIHSHQYVRCFLEDELKVVDIDKNPESTLLLFLLLDYYPCVIKYLNLSNQETLDTLVRICNCDNEEIISAVISCIVTFLHQIPTETLKYLRYNALIGVLMQSASPAAADFRRLAVCQLLTDVNMLFYCGQPILQSDDLINMLNIAMVLLEDDDLVIRNSMSKFATATLDYSDRIVSCDWPVIAEKAREDLMAFCLNILPKDQATNFIFSWACRHLPELSNEASEVFERGEINLFVENIPIIEGSKKILNSLLWSLEDGLSYEDKSIYLEEQTLIVTTCLVDSLSKYPSPMMLKKTKQSVINALKSLVTFLEKYQIGKQNFYEDFEKFFEIKLKQLKKLLSQNDFCSVNKVLNIIYDPVLKDDFNV